VSGAGVAPPALARNESAEAGYHRLVDILEFKPFKNGLPMPDENQPESVQDAQAA